CASALASQTFSKLLRAKGAIGSSERDSISVQLLRSVVGRDSTVVRVGTSSRDPCPKWERRTLFRLVFQLPTVDCLCFGALPIAAPSMASEVARHWIVVTVVIVFAFAHW